MRIKNYLNTKNININKIIKAIAKAFPFIVAIIFASIAIGSISNKSATTDEKYHLARGIMFLETGDMRLNQHHPFLFNTILSIPTQLPPIHNKLVIPSTNSKMWKIADKDGLSDQLVELNGGLEGFTEDILFIPRLLMILISSSFLIWFYFLLKSRFGTFIATTATLLLATSPTYLAHARLVTTDIPAMITMFLSTLALYDYVKSDSPKRTKKLLLFILLYFIALITKYSAVTLVAVYAPLIIFDEILRRDNWKSFFIEIFKKGSVITISILFLLTAAYKFQFATLQEMQYGNEIKITYAYNDINGIKETAGYEKLADGILYVYENVKFPFPQYIHGFYENVINHNIFGHASFFLGERSSLGWRAYFPVSYLIKENLFTVFVTIFALLISGWYFLKELYLKRSWPKEISLAIGVLLFTPTFLLFLSISSTLNLGIRYLLPIYPFIFILIGFVFSLMYKKWKKITVIIFSLGITLNIISILINYPNYISYFNESIARDNRHLYLRDSSFDWLQNQLQMDERVAINNHLHSSLEDTPPNDYLLVSIKNLWGNPNTNSEKHNWLFSEYTKGNLPEAQYSGPVTHIILLIPFNPYYEDTQN